jgi:hypothetical protein
MKLIMPIRFKSKTKALVICCVLILGLGCRKNRIACKPAGSFAYFGADMPYFGGRLRFNGDHFAMFLNSGMNQSGSIVFNLGFTELPKVLGTKILLKDFTLANYGHRPVVTASIVVDRDQGAVEFDPCVEGTDSAENWIIIDRESKDFRKIEGRYHLKMYKASDGGFAMPLEWAPDSMVVENGTFSFFE